VQLRNGKHIAMAALQLNDEVRVGPKPTDFSKVYMFSHNEVEVQAKFVRLETAGGVVLLTGGHYLYVVLCLVGVAPSLVRSVLHASGECQR
jgi:hypothetical protein